ncbi:MAG: prepilin peptidase [Candidatus Pacebacteria bacterium]|nr:prepilin peptidase [Candidatus Paceibacterota bacterium]
MLETVTSIIVFFFGTIIGSFLNVVSLRYRSGRTLGGRSMCFTCGKTLSWFELVPLGSFLTQRGKCGGCRTKISWQYPVVEALTGFVFVALYYRLGYIIFGSPLLFAVLFSYYAILFSILIVLSVYDIKHNVLPDQLTILFASIAFIGMFFIQGDAIILHIPNLTQFLAGIILPAPFSLIWLLSKGKWMGLGDAKLMIGIGFLLGLSSGAAAILISFWVGAIISIILLFIGKLARGTKKISLTTAIPFGPFLALGTVITVVGNIDFATLSQFLSTLFS